MGPLTKGFGRWANLPPSQFDLQSFGHVSVTEDGVLNIKLVGITGEIMWEQTLEAPPMEDSSVKDYKTEMVEGDETETVEEHAQAPPATTLSND